MDKNRELSDMLAELTNFGVSLKTCGNSLKVCGDCLTDCGESLIRTAAVMWNYFSGESGQRSSVQEGQDAAIPAAGHKAGTEAEAKVETNKGPSAGDTAENAVTPEAESKAKSEAETKKLTFIEVRRAFSAKSHEGFTEQVRALIAKYGTDKLSAVKESDYEAIMADLEKIG